MRPLTLLFSSLLSSFFLVSHAQNTTPFWSLAGNSNASATTSKLGTTNAIPLRLFTNNLARVTVTPTGNVGVGTATPAYKFSVDAGAGTVAVYGKTSGSFAVYGAGGTYGVYGVGSQYGVYGTSSRYGVYGGGSSYGIFGISINGFGGMASSTNSDGFDAYTSNGYYGLYASCTNQTGIYGYGGKVGAYGYGGTYGINGYSSGGYGVYGNSFSGYGVYGNSTKGYAGGYFHSVNGYGLGAASDSAAYAAVFFGRVYSSTGFATSDRNLKKDIEDFSDAMAIINKLEPKHYEFKTEAKYAPLHLPSGAHWGLIAQDLEKVLPELVQESKFDIPVNVPAPILHPKTADGKDPNSYNEGKPSMKIENFTIKAVNYQELIPIMIKAMQEQHQQIEELKQELFKLKASINGAGTTVKTAFLEQNTPNPVRGTTTFRYHLPSNTTSAILNVTDAKGQLVKIMTLNNGSGETRLDTNSFPAGAYNCTLTVDGKTIDTKRMIVAR